MLQPRFNSFTLATRWLVEARIEEVAAILADVERLPLWWRGVYLEAELLDAGDATGLGRRFAVRTRGWLPYTLRWQGEVVESDAPHRWTIAATGDLAGRGTWQLTQLGDFTEVTYDWQVLVEKPALRRLAPILKPAFAANHRWAMDRGLEGLWAETARRRAA